MEIKSLPTNFDTASTPTPQNSEAPSRKFYLSIISIALLTISLSIGSIAYLINSNPKSLPAEPILLTPLPTGEPTPTPTILPLPTQSNPASINILLLGKGGANHSGGHLSDSITLAVINPLALKITLISIPRDTYVEIGQPKRWVKINGAFSFSPTDAKLAVASVTGQSVDYYISIDFDRFVRLIDYLGGINVNVTNGFTDNYYPIAGQENNLCGKSSEEMIRIHKLYSGFELEKQFVCRYETLTFNTGMTYMDGQIALKFIRSRHSAQNGSDFARIQRSTEVLAALYANLSQKITTTDINGLFTNLKNFVQTDLNTNIITDINNQTSSMIGYIIKPLPLESTLFKNGVSPLGEFILEPTAGRGGWGPIQDYINTRL